MSRLGEWLGQALSDIWDGIEDGVDLWLYGRHR